MRSAQGGAARRCAPSLYLNLGWSHEQLGDWPTARHWYGLAERAAVSLPTDGYGETVRGGVAAGLRRLAAIMQEGQMGRLIYSMIQSLDGYTEDEQGDFSWGAPDAALHTFINELASSVGTYLYGRRMYETMVYWETAHTLPDQPQHELDWARQWQAAEKIVYSRTLAEPRSARTRIEREFDPEAVRQLKAGAAHDLTVDGPELAAHALRAGLVDEIQLIVCPVVVGGGKRFFPEGVRLELELLEERRFSSGVVVLRYAVRG